MMPVIYLSPSTQEWNPYITGSGSEEQNMNILADRLEIYLRANAIRWQRNRPDMTAGSSARQANQSYYDLYLALHSNASGEGQSGKNRGIIAFYYPGSQQGERAAELIAQELRKIYPLPANVTTRSTTTLGEIRISRFPAVLVEIGYHDNVQDAQWLEGHWDDIAQQLTRALTRFFGLPYIAPIQPAKGLVRVNWGTLNLRSYPSPTGTILANLPNGAEVTVYGAWEGWYVIQWEDKTGYAAAAYIDI